MSIETIVGILAGVIVLLFLSSFRIAQEYQRALVFRLGRYEATRGPGIYWVIPMLEKKSLVDIRTITVDIKPQEAITKDNVTVRVDAVLYYKIIDPEKAIISVARYKIATYQAALTTLRNIIGQNVLDDILKSRDRINNNLKEIIDEVTDPWGIDVERVEIKAVEIPADLQRAMAREAEALREKRARIIKSEGEKEAAEKLTQAAKEIAKNPAALELRRMQMINEVGVEQNTTTIILMPSDFVTLANGLTKYLGKKSSKA